MNDVSAARVQEHLAALRAGEDGISIASSNHYLRSIKMFTRWLVRDHRTADDRLSHLTLLNAKTDVRHQQRRTLEVEELNKRIDAARNGPAFRGLTGPDRTMLYLVAVNTASERAGQPCA